MKDERLPLAALILMFAESGYKSLVYVIGLIVIGFRDRRDGGWIVWVLVAAGAVLVFGMTLVRYLRFTYRLADAQVVIKSGLFVRKTRHIPYAKIQTLRRQQWFFLKPFNLESLTIETSGKNGSEGEAQLYAVAPSVGLAIDARRKKAQAKTVPAQAAPAPALAARDQAAAAAQLGALGAAGQPSESAAVLDPTASAQPSAPVTSGAEPLPAELSYTISAHDLNLYALTSLGFIPILTGALWLWDKFDDIVPKDWEQNVNRYMAQLAVAALVAVVIVALVLGIVISYLRLVQKYYQFTLTQSGDTLTAARGLLKRTQVSTRLHQLQAVRFSQTVIRQWFHLTTVQALIASNASDDEQSDAMVLMPVVKADQALTAMRRFVTWLPAQVPALQTVQRSRYWYYIRNAALGNLVAVLAGLVGIYFWRPSWLLPAALIGAGWVLLAALQGTYAARSAGVKILSSDLLVLQKGGWWRRQRYFVRRANVQSLEVNTSVWLAKRRVCHLVINVRQGDSNENIEVSYLEQPVADAVRAWYRPADFGAGGWAR